MRYLHGTSWQAGMKILEQGFMPERIWGASAPSMTYLVLEDYDRDPKSRGKHPGEDIRETTAWWHALEAAQLASAIKGVEERDCIVFLLDVPYIEGLIHIEPDCSTEDAEGCYQIKNQTLNRLIQDGTATLTAFKIKDAYEPLMRLFYLMGCNGMHIEDETAKKALKRLKKTNAARFSAFFYDEYVILLNPDIEIITQKGGTENA